MQPIITPIEEVYAFKGYHGFPSECGIAVRRQPPHAVIILTELPANPGTSVTNMVEELATQIYHRECGDLEPQNVYVVEHYVKSGEIEETWAFVALDWDQQKQAFTTPDWKPLAAVLPRHACLRRMLASH
jgi:hypothetical protein